MAHMPATAPEHPPPGGRKLPVARGLFYGNWAYGAWAVALTVEAALQQGVPLPPWPYHVLLFAATVLFYTHAYRRGAGTDERTRWYAAHHRRIARRQVLLGVLCAGMVALLLARGAVRPHHLPLLAVFPAIGLAYYGIGAAGLRRIGWLKPFVIGAVWAGVVTWHPAVLAPGRAFPYIDAVGAALLLKNLLFVSLLCILFDIKDEADDRRDDLHTLVVQRGARTTVFRVVVPTLLVGGAIFLAWAAMRGFPWWRVALNVVPFIAFIAVARSLRRKRPLMYYLTVVDGLLLLKALCGIAAVCLP